MKMNDRKHIHGKSVQRNYLDMGVVANAGRKFR